MVGYLFGVCKFGYSKRLEGLNFRPPRNNPNVLVHGPLSQPWRFSNGHVDVRRISSTLLVFDPSVCVFHTGLICICVQREQPLSSTPIGLAYTELKTIK